MQQRSRLKQLKSLEERLAEDAKRLREEAKLLSPGYVRELVLRKARQADRLACKRVVAISRIAAAPLMRLSGRQASRSCGVTQQRPR